MSLGTQKALDTPVVKPADHPAPPAPTPKWDVNHHEVLNQIKQDRAARPEVKAVAQVPAPLHRDVQQQQLQHPHPRLEVQHPVPQPTPVAGGRPDASHPVPGRMPSDGRSQYGQHRPEVTPPQQIAQTHPPIGQPLQPGQQQYQHGRRDTQTQHQNPTEINRTVINNNQRYEYGNNGSNGQNNNNNRYLYGGLAAGALVGGGAAYYANRDSNYAQNYSGAYSDPYRNLNNGYAYNQYNQYNQYDQYNNQYDQYALNQYDQFRYPNGNYADNSYLNGYGNNYDQSYDPIYNNSDNLYGDTTYGGTPFDNGYSNRPIYETTYVDNYPPIYREQNPVAAIPQLFGNLIGGILGTITSSNHRRYYSPDC